MIVKKELEILLQNYKKKFPNELSRWIGFTDGMKRMLEDFNKIDKVKPKFFFDNYKKKYPTDYSRNIGFIEGAITMLRKRSVEKLAKYFDENPKNESAK